MIKEIILFTQHNQQSEKVGILQFIPTKWDSMLEDLIKHSQCITQKQKET